MKAKLKYDQDAFSLKAGTPIEVVLQGYDDAYKEKTYRVVGMNCWFPESDLIFI